jgi:D-alanyl-D-alanine carboxypeptidase
MGIRYRLFLIALLAILAFEHAAAQPGGAFPSDLSAKLSAKLDSLEARLNIAGVAVSIVSPRHGVWVGTAGQANPATGDTIAHDRLFGIGTVTMTFTSAIVLQLVQEGALKLTDTIGRWISGYANVNGRITVRQLLGHTSGVASYTNNPAYAEYVSADPSRMITPDQILQFVGPADFPPGTNFKQSNTGYVLLGMIIERVTGARLADELERRIAVPLALGSVSMGSEDTLPGAIVTHWSDVNSDTVLDDLTMHPRRADYSGAWAASGILSTVSDLALWGNRLYSGTLLSSTMMKELTAFRTINGSYGYGLGVTRSTYAGKVGWGHTGGIRGFTTILFHVPTDSVTIAVTINQSSHTIIEIMTTMLEEFYNRTSAVEPDPRGFAPGARVSMHAAQPNPFTDVTTIPVETSVGATTVVTVHSLLGTPVRTLVDGAMPAGARSLVWDGLDDAGNRLPSGVYVVRMQSGRETTSRRVIKQ